MSKNTEPSARTVMHTPRFWLTPLIVVTLLMSALAALYMGGILDPKKHLDQFPIALVNQDEGDTLPGGDPATARISETTSSPASKTESTTRRSTCSRSVSPKPNLG